MDFPYPAPPLKESTSVLLLLQSPLRMELRVSFEVPSKQACKRCVRHTGKCCSRTRRKLVTYKAAQYAHESIQSVSPISEVTPTILNHSVFTVFQPDILVFTEVVVRRKSLFRFCVQSIILIKGVLPLRSFASFERATMEQNLVLRELNRSFQQHSLLERLSTRGPLGPLNFGLEIFSPGEKRKWYTVFGECERSLMAGLGWFEPTQPCVHILPVGRYYC